MFSDVFITLTQAPAPAEIFLWWKDPALIGLIGAVIGGSATFAGSWLQQRAENNRINRSWKRDGIQQLVAELIHLRNDVHSCKQAMLCASADSLPSFFAKAYQASSACNVENVAEANTDLRATVSWRWPWRSSLEVLVELYLPERRELLRKLDSEVRDVGTRLNEIQNYALEFQNRGSPADQKDSVWAFIGETSKKGGTNSDLAIAMIEEFIEYLRLQLSN